MTPPLALRTLYFTTARTPRATLSLIHGELRGGAPQQQPGGEQEGSEGWVHTFSGLDDE